MTPAVGQRRSCGGATYDIIAASTLIVGWFRIRWADTGHGDEYPAAALVHDDYLGQTPSPTHATPGPVDVAPSSSTGPGADGDRSKCRPWCGLKTTRIYGTPMAKDYVSALSWAGPDAVRWCSGDCHDRRHPPIPNEKSAASPGPADRSGCKPFCGLRYREDGLSDPGHPHHEVWLASDGYGDGARVWCSVRCDEFKLPPVESKPPSATLTVGGQPAQKTEQPRPRQPAGITCPICLNTSFGGDLHRDTCHRMRERGPSAVAAAPGRVRDTFADLCDEFDLLPDVRP